MDVVHVAEQRCDKYRVLQTNNATSPASFEYVSIEQSRLSTSIVELYDTFEGIMET